MSILTDSQSQNSKNYLVARYSSIFSGSIVNPLIKIWDLNSFTTLKTFNSSKQAGNIIINTMLVIDESYFVYCVDNYTIIVWNLVTNELKFKFDQSNNGHTDLIQCLVEINASLIASGAKDGIIKLWDLNKGVLKTEFYSSRGNGVASLVLLKNGYLASGFEFENVVKIWDVNNIQLKYTLSYYQYVVLDIVDNIASINNELIASVNGYSILVWNLTSANLVFKFNSTFGGHSNWVKSLVVLDNGYLVSGSDDNSIKVVISSNRTAR